MKFKILRGLENSLATLGSDLKVAGYWYLTTDTHRLYTCLKDGEDPILVSQADSFDPTEINNRLDKVESDIASLKGQVASGNVVTVNTRAELDNTGNAESIYIVVEENAAYRWVEGKNYQPIGRDYEEIQCIWGGDATTVAD